MTLPNANFTHQCLIAMPDMQDNRFMHAVTYIVRHDEDGAVGLVVNRPLELTIGELLSEVRLPVMGGRPPLEQPVLYGGPVSTEAGFVLHEEIGHWNSSLEVEDNICVTSSRDILDAISQGKGPSRYQIMLGYAGWAAGQLEKEIVENAWLVCPADAPLLFDLPYDLRWEAAARRIGVDVNLLSAQVGHA
jgi:putative transcriptional regulator